jgi:PKD repeat protein
MEPTSISFSAKSSQGPYSRASNGPCSGRWTLASSRRTLLRLALLLGGVAVVLQMASLASASFVAVGGGGNLIKTSPDGLSWAPSTAVYSEYNNAVSYGGAGAGVGPSWVITGDLGDTTSSTGSPTWTWKGQGGTPVANRLNGVAYATPDWVIVGQLGWILTGPATTNGWAESNAGTTSELNAVAHGGALWTTVGDGGILFVSPNGATWAPVASGVGSNLNGVSFSGCSWATVGDGGTVSTSQDATAWTPVPSGVTNNLNAVAFGNGRWVAVGDAGTIITSPGWPLWTWTPAASSGTAANLKGVAFDGARWVAVGIGGTIVTTTNPTLSWAPVSGLPAGEFRAVASDHDNTAPCPPPPPPPVAQFTIDPYPCGVPQTVTFHDTSTASPGATIEQSDWNYGDANAFDPPQALPPPPTNQNKEHYGNPAPLTLPYPPYTTTVTHTYAAVGTYHVTLVVTDNYGQTSAPVTHDVNISLCGIPPPIASFLFTNPPCGVPVSVTFTDTSTPGPGASLVRSFWDWGDASTSTYNPWTMTVTHTYTTYGTYTVSLTVTDSNGQTGTFSEPILIFKCPPPPPPPAIVMSFTATLVPSDVKACGDHVASFASSVSGGVPPFQYSWNFGDSGQSNVANPSHHYDRRATYTITLTVGDTAGQSVQKTKTLDAVGFVPCYATSAVPAQPPEAAGPQDGQDLAQTSSDSDGDGAPDAADNCPLVSNPDQKMSYADSVHNPRLLGDACNPDIDGDGILNAADNCVDTPSPDTSDTDADGVGDACDPDADGDGIVASDDNCPTVRNADQMDSNRDGVGDACQSEAALTQLPTETPGKSVDPARNTGVAGTAPRSARADWLPVSAAGAAAGLLVGLVATALGRRLRTR